MVLTVSTGLCAWPRLWQRQDGLMLTTPQPQLLWKKACVIKPSECDLSASMVQTGEERKPMLGHPEVGVKENAQISTTRGALRRLGSGGWLQAHTATRLEDCPEECSFQDFH